MTFERRESQLSWIGAFCRLPLLVCLDAIAVTLLLWCALRPPGHPRQMCHLWVEDNGIGFEEKYLDRIFEPFQRLHGRGRYEGSGMGLAICRKIVARHDGYLTARSVPGQGTTFVVTLPTHQPARERPL